MKKFDRLAFYGWPALAVIILFSSFTALLLLPNIKKAPLKPLFKAAAVRYAVTDNSEPLSSEEMTEIRALYASDLFVSSRASRFPALNTITNRLNQTNITPSVTPLFLPFNPASNEVNTRLAAINTPGADNDADDLPLFVHLPKQSNRQKQKNFKFSVELKGELKCCSLEPDIFQGISPSLPAVLRPALQAGLPAALRPALQAGLPAVLRPALQAGLPADRKPWSLQAQMRINRQGRVDHVFAESTDCEPSVYQAIVNRLYQCHFSNVTETCEGTIIISYPAYIAP